MSKENPTRLKDLAEKTNDAFVFTLDQLYVEPGWNARRRTAAFEAGIRELMDSIRAVGVKNPIIVSYENGRAKITEGHRRYEAVSRLRDQGITVAENGTVIYLRAVPELPNTTEEQRVASLYTRNTSVPLTAQEKAGICKRLRNDFQWDAARIGRELGMSKLHAEQLLLLADAPPEILEMLDREEFAATTAIKALQERGPEGAIDLLKDATAQAALLGKDKATPKHLAQVKAKRGTEAAVRLAQDADPEAHSSALEGPQIDEDEEAAPEPSPAPQAVAKVQPKVKAQGQAPEPEAAPIPEALPPTPAPKPKASVPQPEPQASDLMASQDFKDWKKVALAQKKHMEAIFDSEPGSKAFEKAISNAAAFHTKTWPEA